MSIPEEIPVLPLAFGSLQNPWPRALLPLLEAEVGGVEERTVRIVYQNPSRTRDESLLNWLTRLFTARAIKCARCALQILRIRHARVPADLFTVNGEFDRQVFRREAPIRAAAPLVGQLQSRCLQRQRLF